MGLVPGSYIPRFTLPAQAADAVADPGNITDLTISPPSSHLELSPDPLMENGGVAPARAQRNRRWVYALSAVVLVAGCLGGYRWMHRATAQELYKGRQEPKLAQLELGHKSTAEPCGWSS
jgi:hypothetical protein